VSEAASSSRRLSVARVGDHAADRHHFRRVQPHELGGGLAGTWATLPLLPARLPLWLLCVGLGGLLGTWIGALRLNPRTLRLLLAFLLLTAAAGRMIAASL
jgi:hypothetical protein